MRSICGAAAVLQKNRSKPVLNCISDCMIHGDVRRHACHRNSIDAARKQYVEKVGREERADKCVLEHNVHWFRRQLIDDFRPGHAAYEQPDVTAVLKSALLRGSPS